jgi:hypothetical protein
MDFRNAIKEDLDAIVLLLANDPLGAKRERYTQPLPEAYIRKPLIKSCH